MDDMNRLCDSIKDKILDSAPDIWQRLKKSAAKRIVEQLIKELNGVPSNCGKLICEQVNKIPVARKVA
ncbi:MAG: hypothetical protein FIA99_13845 [Ruminiclostridium sp.]|nr:hypothetical protein [Ruminiclostridium sp.]